MKSSRLAVLFGIIAIGISAQAGVGGVVVKGAFKTWDEIARLALKVSGKPLTDDAVKGTAKMIESAAGKYGDDVAVATIRGGVEVSEETLKTGGRFFVAVKKSGVLTDDALQFLARNSDEVLKLSSKYGDDILRLNGKVPGVMGRGVKVFEKSGVDITRALKSVSELPKEDIPRVLGAMEKNPSVAREIVEHIEKGGKYFVDKIFALHGKQIVAGGLTSAMIVAAVKGMDVAGEVATNLPIVVDGRNQKDEHDKAMTEIEKMSDSKREEWAKGISDKTQDRADMFMYLLFGSVAVFVLIAGALVYVRISGGKAKKRDVVDLPVGQR